MDQQTVLDVADVIETLGGPTAVGKLVGRSPQSVVNWRAANRIPPDTFLILQAELRSLGKVAPPALWGMREQASDAI